MSQYDIGRLRGKLALVYYDAGGKRHRHALGTADPREADRIAPALYAELTRPKGKAVADLWQAYTQDKAGRAVLTTMAHTWKAMRDRFGGMAGDDIQEMWGDGAVQAPACMVVCSSRPVGYLPSDDGDERRISPPIARTNFAGVALGSFNVGGHGGWERWKGTFIFIPRIVEIERKSRGWRIDQLLMGPMQNDELWKLKAP